MKFFLPDLVGIMSSWSGMLQVHANISFGQKLCVQANGTRNNAKTRENRGPQYCESESKASRHDSVHVPVVWLFKDTVMVHSRLI
jgi:hypothetical protein